MDLHLIAVSAASILGSLIVLAIFITSAWFVLWKLLLSKMPVFRAMFGLDREETVPNQAAVTPTEKARNRKVD